MALTVPTIYRLNNPTPSFFFEPMKQKGTVLKTIAVAVLVLITLITAGIWLIPFAMYGTLEGRVTSPSKKEMFKNLDPPLRKIIESTPPFRKYEIPFDPTSPYKNQKTTLCSVYFRPCNIFFDKLFEGTDITTTLPGSGQLFKFNQDHRMIKDFIQKLDDGRVFDVRAQGYQSHVYSLPKAVNLTDIFGHATYRISAGEIKDILDSQRIFVSRLLPLEFYRQLKERMRKENMIILPGSDSAPIRLSDVKSKEIQKLLQEARENPEKYGFSNINHLKWLEAKTLYQIGSLVVKTEDYHCFIDENGKIRDRKAGTLDTIRLINACGIRGFWSTPDPDNREIIQNTFSTALSSVDRGFMIFPAVGMGVWRGDPNIYWCAFLDAIIRHPHVDSLERIFVNPCHQASKGGLFDGAQGEEFQEILTQYLAHYAKNPQALKRLNKIVNLYEKRPDVIHLALNLKKNYPDKIVSVLNASDPDVTLCDHVTEYMNGVPNGTTTEENYSAMGSNGLCFEGITGIFEKKGRILPAKAFLIE